MINEIYYEVAREVYRKRHTYATLTYFTDDDGRHAVNVEYINANDEWPFSDDTERFATIGEARACWKGHREFLDQNHYDRDPRR